MGYTLKAKSICEKYGITAAYLKNLEDQGHLGDAVLRTGKTPWYDPEKVETLLLKFVKDNPSSKLANTVGTEHEEQDEDGMSMMEAKKLEQVMKAKLAQLKFEKESGRLVEKQAVYRELFAIGKSIRDALLAVPDRCVDDVLAARSRREAHGVMTAEIAKALEGLTGAAEKFEKAFGIDAEDNLED